MADVTLHAARADNVEGLVALLHETFRSTWQPMLTAAAIERYWRKDVARRYVTEEWPRFIVAEAGDDVVGMIDCDDGFISALHVTDRMRRQGIGRSLLERVEVAAVATGTECLRLETDSFNTAAQALYVSCGFREIDRYPDEEWQSGLTTVLMEKTLA